MGLEEKFKRKYFKDDYSIRRHMYEKEQNKMNKKGSELYETNDGATPGGPTPGGTPGGPTPGGPTPGGTPASRANA